MSAERVDFGDDLGSFAEQGRARVGMGVRLDIRCHAEAKRTPHPGGRNGRRRAQGQ
jgi:hypothetical protein